MTYLFECEECGTKETVIITKECTLPVRGKKITLIATIRVCAKCENEIFDEALDEETLSKAYAQYREQYDIISPLEIKRIRESYCLSQRSLGKILGWGDATINRYETGAIPDSAHNKILHLLHNPSVVKDLLEQSRAILSPKAYKKGMECIDKMAAQSEQESFLRMVQKRTEHPNVGIESGFKQVNISKIINVILYFANNIDELWITKLNKLLFYTDFLCFKKVVNSLTGLQYLHYEYGPVPTDFDWLFSSIEKCGYIELKPTTACNGSSGKIVRSLFSYSKDDFTESELEILKKVKEKYGDYSCTKISNISHEEEAWKETEPYQIISYEYAENIQD